jgi:hypothetical protein
MSFVSGSRYSYTFTLPDMLFGDTETGLGLLATFLTPSPASSIAYEFWKPQLEPGPVATPFEHRPYGTELALCQRYYQKLVGNHLSGVSNGVDATRVGYNFPTTMRVPPTFIPQSGNIGVWNGTSVSPGSVERSYTSSNAMEMDVTGAQGTLVGGAVIVYIGSFTSDDYIGLDAEL